MNGPPTPRVNALAAVLANEPAHPWERQPAESEEDYTLFCGYRDRKPPRGSVYSTVPGYHVRILKLCQDHHWFERVQAWDRYLQRIDLETRVAEVEKTAKERAKDHLVLTNALFELTLREAQKLLQRAQETEGAGLVLKPAELIKLADIVVKLERLIHGEATERVETDSADYSALSIEEIEKLAELNRKIVEAQGSKEPH